MPPNPALRNRAKPPTQSTFTPAKALTTTPRPPAPPAPPPLPNRGVQPSRWRSGDQRLRIEDRGYELTVFSDGRNAGSITPEDAESLIGALVLSLIARGARSGTLSGKMAFGDVHITFGTHAHSTLTPEGDKPVPPPSPA